MRLSQAQFAEAVRAAGNAMGVPNHCTKRLVQKWETGEHAACRPDYLRVLQAVTGLSARELGFRILPDDSVGGTPGEADRPDGAAGNRAAGFVMSGMTEYTSDAMIEGSMERLRYALEHPSSVDSRTAAFVETATSRLFDLEYYSPARLLAPTVERHLSTVTSLLTAARHEGVRRSLMLSAGRTAALAGWLAFDRGNTPSANRLWDIAISTAEGTSDEALLAATLTYMSYAAERRGDLGTAWQFAHTASLHASKDPRAAAWANARVALYAAQRDDRAAARKAVEYSLDLGGSLPDPKPGDGTAPWMRFFDLARLLSSTAHTTAVLKDPGAYDYAGQAQHVLGSDTHKTRAVVLAEVALVGAIVGELEFCLDTGSTAAALTRDLDVSIAADLLYQIVPVILPYSDTRAVRELLPQLTRLNRTADLEDEVEEK